MKTLILSCVFLAALLPANSFKVVSILPFASNSHFAIGSAITKSLLNDGNQVTVISPYPKKKPVPNHRDIDVSSVLEQMKKDQIPDAFKLGEMSLMVVIPFLYKIGGEMVTAYLSHPEVKTLMDSGEKFDVCIIEMFNADAFLGLADHFDCVLITYTTFAAVKWIDDMTSNQSPYSYVPHPFLSYTDKMTFSQRMTNVLLSQYENFAYHAFHLPNQEKLYNKYFPNARKSFNEIYKSSAIIFLNNHVSSSFARPYLPNMIEIGGIHVEPAKPLPKNIQEFLDSAKDGVILFSMGSMIQAVNWPIETREALVKAFGKLKQKVLWKYENDTLPNKPDNVMISPWIPQRDIVAHPNVKVFITHGGLLGTTEALVEGVPVLGIPVFGDQRMNMAKAVTRGYGLQVEYNGITEEKVSKALNELLSNPKYSENAKRISSIFNDRPLTPQQAVVYWTKYALKHKGAPHLKAAGNSLSFVEFHLIDVYATLAVIALAILFLNYSVLKFLISKLFSKKADKKQKTK